MRQLGFTTDGRQAIPTATRQALELASSPQPHKDPNGFLRRWDSEYLKRKTEEASRSFIPELTSPFLRSLITAQRNFKPDDSVRSKMIKLRTEADTKNTEYKRLKQQMGSLSDKQSPQYHALDARAKAALQESNKASKEMWRRYTWSRNKATETACSSYASQDPQMAASTKLACAVEKELMTWSDAVEQYNEQTASVSPDEILPIAMKHYQAWVDFIEKLLTTTMKMPADFVAGQKAYIQEQVDMVLANMRRQYEMRSIVSDILYRDLLRGTEYFAGELNETNKSEAAELLSSNLTSGRIEAGKFISDFLKMPASTPQEIDKAKAAIKARLIKEPKQTAQALQAWILTRVNSELGTVNSKFSQISTDTDPGDQLELRLIDKLNATEYEFPKEVNPQGLLQDEQEVLKILEWTSSTTANSMDDFTITNDGVRMYVEQQLIPQLLFMNNTFTDKMGDGDRDVFLGTILPERKTTLNTIGTLCDPSIMPITVHQIVSTHGTALPRTYTEKGGCLFVALDNLHMDTAAMYEDAVLWQEDFDNNNGLDACEHPEYINPYFTAYLSKLASDTSGEQSPQTKFREQYLASHLTEEVAMTQTKAFIDTVHHQMSSNEPRYFWGAKLIGLGDALLELLGSHSRITELFEPLKETFDENVNDGKFYQVGNSNYNTFIFSILRTEAKLQAIANSEDPIQALAEGLAGTVISSDKVQSRGLGQFEWLQQVLVTQLLTEKLIGKGVYDNVNWEGLAQFNFVEENKTFKANWAEFIKNPKAYVEAGKDPNGLMRLRHAWYKFFNDKMGNFEKIKAYIAGGKLQEATRSIVNREFKSYAKRLEEHPQWREYYQENLAFAAA